MNEKEARNILDQMCSKHHWRTRAEGYLEAIEKAKVLEDELRKLAKMKADYGYRSPEQQDIKVTSLIVNIGTWVDEALAQWEKEK